MLLKVSILNKINHRHKLTEYGESDMAITILIFLFVMIGIIVLVLSGIQNKNTENR